MEKDENEIDDWSSQLPVRRVLANLRATDIANERQTMIPHNKIMQKTPKALGEPLFLNLDY